MIYLQAFFVGGFLCALFQFLWMATKLSPTTLLKIGFILAAVLASFGITGKLMDFAQAGFFVMVVGAGDAAYSGTVALLNGDPSPLIQFLAVIAILILLGFIGGYITPISSKRSKGKNID